MVDYSRGIFFWFEVVPFLLHIHFTYEFQQLDTKYCVQIRNVALAQAKTIVVNKCKVLKLDYPQPVLKSLDRLHFLS